MSDDEIVTLDDVLAAEEHWEETTKAVLGGSDGKNCSYSQGYVYRQALYSCLTCTPVDNPNFVAAGICLACSLKCHDGHDLVELYTKRNFRCDCGNKKYPNTPCALEPIKEDYNESNKYNQNFRGLYCECHRPYPDPEEDDEDEDDEMIQCVVCEDWFHGRHTGNDAFDLDSEQPAEFICSGCTEKNDFLIHYPILNRNPNPAVGESDDAVSATEVKDIASTAGQNEETTEAGPNKPTVTSPSEPTTAGQTEKIPAIVSFGDCKSDSEKQSESTELHDAGSQDTRDSGIASGDGSVGDASEETHVELMAEAEPGTSKSRDPQLTECFIKAQLLSKEKVGHKGSVWFAEGWRAKLCRCMQCLDLYKSNGVSFLINPEDTLDAYEAKGKESDGSDLSTQALMQNALSRLDRVGQIEFLHGFNEMKDGLSDLLRNITASGRVVTATDIREFFSEMQAAKRRRLDDVYIPDNCR